MLNIALYATGVLTLLVESVGQTKECSQTVTAAMRQNALANVAKYEWAKAEQKAAIEAAKPFVAMPDEALWKLVPSQEVPRTIHVQLLAGNDRVSSCPNCGTKILKYGNYPWICDVMNMPWKVKCPSCGEICPKNDFGKCYESALDKHGFFRRGKGDPNLLFNADHPDPNDALHKAWVDDGYGYEDPKTGRWDFIVDLCRLRGSTVHRLSWHGPPGDLTVDGASLVPQATGSFAGETVQPEQLDKDWRAKPGYSFLQRVKRTAHPPQSFFLDWKVEQHRGRVLAGTEPHLRVHSLTPLQELATAVGEPPQNKAGNPRWLNYVIQTRTGDKDLESFFVNVLEPYDTTPFVKSVRNLKATADPAAGM